MGDSEESRFEEDLKKAMALSLETAALERFRNGKLRFLLRWTNKNVMNLHSWWCA